MIRRLTVREKGIFIATLIVVIFSFLYNGLIVPLGAKKDFLDEEIMIQQEQLTRELGIIQRSKALDARYNTYLRQFSKLGTGEEMASSVISEIEETVGKMGLHVVELKPRKVQRNEYENQFLVSLTINSELVDIVRFLYTLQQQPHLFDVEEIEFEKLTRGKQATITTRLILSKAFIPLQWEAKRRVEEVDEKPFPIDITMFKPKPFEMYAKGFAARDLFQSLREKLETDTQAIQKALPALHKRIKLIGILLDGDSKAIVENLEERQTHFLSKGESIGTVFLEDIREDRVVFTYNNERIEMSP